MASVLRQFYVLFLSVSIVIASAHAVAEPNGNALASLVIHSAFAVGEGDGEEDGFRRLARSKLGCAPCSEIVVQREDDEITYLYDGDSGVEIANTMISGSRIDKVDGSFVLAVMLNDGGRALVAPLTDSTLERAANFVSGEFIDVVSMMTVASYYVVGQFETIEDARAVAAKLGVTPAKDD